MRAQPVVVLYVCVVCGNIVRDLAHYHDGLAANLRPVTYVSTEVES